MTQQDTKKIAVCTHKGGTGKTVTSMALAAALAGNGGRCLLIDLDPQGHSTLGLGVEPEPDQPTVTEFFGRHPTLPFAEIIRRTYLENLYLAPSDLRLAWTAEGLSGRPKKEELLKRGLRPVEKNYRWILMDTPPSLGVLTQNALAAADYVIIPSESGARAGEAIADLLELLHLIKGEGFEDYGILLTRIDSRKTRSNEALRDAIANWQSKVFRTVIPQSEPLNQAQMSRKDIFSHDPNSKGATAYREFADEFLSL